MAQVESHRVVLYQSGRRHAGENLAELLRLRAEGLPPPVQVGDALASNWSHDFTVIVAKCLAHARRQFVELEAAFPAECRRVLDALAQVYRFEAETGGMTVTQRLAYHQAHSGSVMACLRAWVEEQLRGRLVEPNSSLGKALTYLRNHWDGLTRFLTDGRAPLDSNAVERALKLAVLNRKNSLFYRTAHGAAVGDILTSLVETCRLNGVAAWDYLLALVRQPRAVRAAPGQWLPWNYPSQPEAQRAA